MPNALIRVLIVDDSAFVRKIVREMLSRSPFIDVVGLARDGEEGLQMAKELNPDVITCDLIMPRLDGVEFVRKQMEIRPVPILILTASPKEGPRVLEALEAGAVDLVRKPTALATEGLLVMREELIERVKAAAVAPMKPRVVVPPPKSVFEPHPLKVDLVVIGVSTGGPQALRYLMPQFPADFPVPIAIVLHMPVGYTLMFAEKLNSLSNMEVVEACNGQKLRAGQAILAAAGKHLVFHRANDGSVLTHLIDEPNEKPHKPSVDVLFQSAAETFRNRILGVVMTGMGNDGKQGAAWIKAQGGTVITEAEESCVIYGMPRSVVEAGLSDGAYPLTSLAQTIMRLI